MIKNIINSGKHVHISERDFAGYYQTGADTGTLRYNQVTRDLEVWNGSRWQAISTSISIGLSPEAEDAINWVLKHKQEEERLEKLMQLYPALRDLKDKFEVMRILCSKETDAAG